MDMKFDRGDSGQPKGHALIYFNNNRNSETLATYLVVLPIALHIGKYLPPLLASQVPGLGGSPPAIVPIPPVPEQVESVAYLERMAKARDDDLIYGGSLNPNDLEAAMRKTMELGQHYLKLYEDFCTVFNTLDQQLTAEPHSDLDAREVLYSLMGEHDRLQELAKLTGQLRYALDGNDVRSRADIVHEMERLAKYLPAKYRIAEFISAAQTPGGQGRRLAELHMERCYKLFNEDYGELANVEAELKRLTSPD